MSDNYQMPKNGWQECKLGEVYDFASGLSKRREEFGFGYDFVAFKDVFNNFFLPKTLTNLANTSDGEKERCSVKRGDVFLTRTSETQEELGMSSVALKDYPNATFNGFTKRLRPKGVVEILPEFAGFYFRSPWFRSSVTSMASITTRASLNNEMLSALSIILPPLPEQRAIAGVLSSLDDKIDLLHRQNKTLEGMAEALWRKMFVPACAGEPSADREEARPGWDEKGLDEIAIFLNGLPCQKYPPDTSTEPLPVIKIKELRTGITSDSDLATSKVPIEYIVDDGDILFSWSGSLEIVIWSWGKGVLNQHLFKVTSDNYPKWFCYYWIKHHLAEFRDIAQDKATTMGHIQRHHLSAAKVLVPDEKSFEYLNTKIGPLFEKMIHNLKAIRKLAHLRDTLLPKLMSGEVSVKL